MKRARFPKMLSMVILPWVVGCSTMMTQGPSASTNLAPTAGNNARGTVTFTQQGDKVLVVAKVAGLSPGGHGFHIHEKGDCSAPDAMSAGGHFNPNNQAHGGPNSAAHHGGDLGMLQADSNGEATLTESVDIVTVGSGNATDIVGKSVIVHKDPDDFVSQPTGNSGSRVACGVIAKS